MEPYNRGRRFPAEVYERDQVDALMRACSTRYPTGIRNRALIALMYRGGLRLSEALALRPSDIDWKRGIVHIRHGKGDESRRQPIDVSALDVVERWRQRRAGLGVKRAPLFCTLEGKPLSASYVRTLLPRLARKAGIDGRVHAHGFRHTYASELARDGFSLLEIQALLGHKRASTTDRYLARVAPEQLAERVRSRPNWQAGADAPLHP